MTWTAAMSGDALTHAPSGDPREAFAREVVGQVLGIVLERIRPRAVVLYGSLGRGEGTVYVRNGRPVLLSDVEMGVVSAAPIGASLAEVRRELGERASVDVTLSRMLPARFRRPGTSNWQPFGGVVTLEQFDLLRGLKVLWGRDPRRGFEPRAESICPWDAPRLLLNRIAEIIECLSAQPGPDTAVLTARMAKGLIAASDAVLIGRREYHHSCAVRLERVLDASWPESLWGVAGREAVGWAYRWKLDPAESAIGLNEALRSVVVPSVHAAFEGALGIRAKSLGDLAEQYVSHPRLAACCRVYPSRPALQSAVLRAKGVRRGGPAVTWRGVHAVYGDILRWLDRNVASQVPDRGSAPVPLVAADEAAEGRRLAREWRATCAVL